MPQASKLSKADIRKILSWRQKGKTYVEIAKSFGRMKLTIQGVRYHCVQNGISKPQKAA